MDIRKITPTIFTCHRTGRAPAFPIQVFIWLVLSIFIMGCEQSEPVAIKDDGPVELVMPAQGAYPGAYVDFGEGESHVTYDGLTDFEKMIEKHLAVVAFGNFWGDQEFSLKTVRMITGYGAIPLLFWSPWDKPYEERKWPDRFSLNEILAGNWDSYIDQWAAPLPGFGLPFTGMSAGRTKTAVIPTSMSIRPRAPWMPIAGLCRTRTGWAALNLKSVLTHNHQ